MKPSDAVIEFGEWWPDLEGAVVQGLVGQASHFRQSATPPLTIAKDVLYFDGTYRQFKTLGTTGLSNLASEPLGGLIANEYTYTGLSNSIQRATTSVGSWVDFSQTTDNSYSTTTSWRFERFDDYVIATNGVNTPQVQTLGSASRFADLSTAASASTAPASYAVGKIARFIVVGNTESANYHVQWCAIGNPRDWPTPGSDTANSRQAGEQYLNPEWGDVTGIVGGDQFGLIFQQGGLTRVTYIAGDQVFQFDELEGSNGNFFPHSIVEARGRWYYISKAGICATDGTSVAEIGNGRVDRYFWTNYLSPNVQRVFGAADSNRNLIFWCFQNTTGSAANEIIAYNYTEDRFTSCDQDVNCLLTDTQSQKPTGSSVWELTIVGFNTSHGGRTFDGTIGSALMELTEQEPVPGAFIRLQGVKAVVAGQLSAVSISVRARNRQDATVTFNSSSCNTRTEFAPFNLEGRYFVPRLALVSTVVSAHGLHFQFAPSGST